MEMSSIIHLSSFPYHHRGPEKPIYLPRSKESRPIEHPAKRGRAWLWFHPIGVRWFSLFGCAARFVFRQLVAGLSIRHRTLENLPKTVLRIPISRS